MDKKEEQEKGAFKTLPLSHDCEFFLVTGISVYACECTPHHILIDNVEYVQADQVTILYDDTPEKEPQEYNIEALRKELAEYTKAYNQECERNYAIKKDLEYWAQRSADLLKELEELRKQ